MGGSVTSRGGIPFGRSLGKGGWRLEKNSDSTLDIGTDNDLGFTQIIWTIFMCGKEESLGVEWGHDGSDNSGLMSVKVLIASISIPSLV